MSSVYYDYHNHHISSITPEKENEFDPDDRNSKLCIACTLPIFSTPFQVAAVTTDGGGELFLHDECAGLPKEVIGHALHPQGKLILEVNPISNINSSSSSSSSFYFPSPFFSPPSSSPSSSSSPCCSNCNRECGSIYRCSVRWCDFKLDVLCAFPVKILHRSHVHRLMVIKAGSAPFVCGACGTQHKENRSHLFYLCNACEFLIHPDCASLPNAINLMHHQHSLLLTYGQYEKPRRDNACAICKGDIQSLGAYVCVKCKYFAHIHCAISNPQSFKSVLIRDAKVADLLHFPLSENTSVMPYIFEKTGSNSSSVDDRDQIEGKLAPEVLHQHPLIQIDGGSSGDESMSPRVCNACVQLISPPFYSCSECPDFFLHSCCANLPSQIQHRAHQHPLSLFPKAPNSYVSGFFRCHGCCDTSNKFAYSCNTCGFQLDVVCASLPPAITHELHGNSTHILYMFGGVSLLNCNLCNGNWADIVYKCINCHDFAIDAGCAMFPSSVKHKYDEHPLKLTIDNEDEHICEICEETIESRERFYSCSHHCDQSFHSDCIPSVNISSRIKLGVTIHVDRHDCPLTLILQSTVYGYHCDYCLQTFYPSTYYETPVYECSKCYFRIHDECAAQCLL